MKKFTIIFLLFSISCSKQKETTQNQSDLNSKNKKEILSIIHGGWLKQEYIDSLTKTKSPYLSFKQNQAYTELIIDTTNTIGDTIVNPGCLANGKEGHYFYIVMQNDSLNETKLHMHYNQNYIDNDFFLEYSIKSDDTILYLIQKNMTTGNISNKAPYKKIYNTPSVKDYSFDPTNMLINNLLFVGKYKLYDAMKKEISPLVEFKETHKVKGFPNFQNYYIENYFGAVKPNPFDFIVLSSSEQSLNFSWTIENNSIKLYEILSNGDARKKGRLKFVLEKL